MVQKIRLLPKRSKFQQDNGDHNLYSKISHGKIILLALYGDNLLMMRNCIKKLIKLKKKIYEKFEMSKLSKKKVTLYLKTKCIQVKEGIFMIQKAYI